jgi:hypothetical protein
MRLEYKYLIPNSILPRLKKDVLPFLEYDTHINPSNQIDYTVRSIYFDNKKLDYYYEKVEGIKVRKKLRIRGYDYAEGKNIIFLEIKKKHENFIFKNRSPLYYEDLKELFESGDIEKFVSEKYKNEQSVPDGKRFFYHFINRSLKPVILVVYEREAYFCKFDNRLRITFDKNLRYQSFPHISELYADDNLPGAIMGSTILEIKFKHSMPMWLQNIIIKYGLSRKALSKYVICLDEFFQTSPLKGNIRSTFLNHLMQDDLRTKQGIEQ